MNPTEPTQQSHRPASWGLVWTRRFCCLVLRSRSLSFVIKKMWQNQRSWDFQKVWRKNVVKIINIEKIKHVKNVYDLSSRDIFRINAMSSELRFSADITRFTETLHVTPERREMTSTPNHDAATACSLCSCRSSNISPSSSDFQFQPQSSDQRFS